MLPRIVLVATLLPAAAADGRVSVAMKNLKPGSNAMVSLVRFRKADER